MGEIDELVEFELVEPEPVGAVSALLAVSAAADLGVGTNCSS